MTQVATSFSLCASELAIYKIHEEGKVGHLDDERSAVNCQRSQHRGNMGSKMGNYV